ncbi:(Fe-S)-binding protein [Aurantimonas coralicida]|uniref:(Fe-S)-binding protein n=1 Tax=Aurantimonas coralicida TaxID=182270 RepID=UPI00238E5501|nr:(Fe-S)-binding protein [Aurantimonas coralicida]MDE0924562.1 (Fe-S)-binding protein [Aurantimonas coralicida]
MRPIFSPLWCRSCYPISQVRSKQELRLSTNRLRTFPNCNVADAAANVRRRTYEEKPLSENAVRSETRPQVALFVTCLVDLFRPSVGFAAIKLLEESGCDVVVPTAQTCCGQPAYNSGDRADTRAIAEQVIATFEGFDYVVAPSGSCGAMLKKHYPELFAGDAEWEARALAFSDKVFELVSFLADVRGMTGVTARVEGTATYHDSCSGLRELGVKAQPRMLLDSVEGLELTELRDSEVCCGFGGTFCIKYPDVSNAIVTKKARNVGMTGADMLLAGDLGCLMNMDGKLKRENIGVEVRHVAEVLAGMTDAPPIGGKL